MARTLAAYPSDDRAALGLLLLPLLILAASLGLSQTWRYTAHALPEIAISAPFGRPITQPSTAPTRTPPSLASNRTDPTTPSISATPPVELTIPGSLRYPGEAPNIDVASLNIRPMSPAPVTGPVTQPTVPIAPPSVDIAAWSPPQLSWQDRLSAPPVLDPPAVEQPTRSPITAAPISPLPLPDAVCQASTAQLAAFATAGRMSKTARAPLADTSDPVAFGLKLATAARAQTQDLVIYSARYHPMAYPMGDMPSFFGACTDVIIRAYRTVGLDLQELVQRTHSGRGDTNIDHRRTETLRTLFTRGGASLPITRYPEDYKPGDIVTYHRPFSRVSASHIAMVSDVLAPSGRPMIVHNRGWGPQLEDALFVDRITGHYRYRGPAAGTDATVVASAATPPRGLVRASFPGASIVARRLGHAREASAPGAVPKSR